MCTTGPLHGDPAPTPATALPVVPATRGRSGCGEDSTGQIIFSDRARRFARVGALRAVEVDRRFRLLALAGAAWDNGPLVLALVREAGLAGQAKAKGGVSFVWGAAR